ncbi:hypothetical protein D1AOALGA4SA_5712 [Olavius algarvensis Delta 1 endosymbiont]|nr:hypothetical protein D1AOALGA4SA_5712 [Olavius algarvensis Delta 1 endosymbiont]
MLITFRYILEIPDYPAAGIRYPDIRRQMAEVREKAWLLVICYSLLEAVKRNADNF